MVWSDHWNACWRFPSWSQDRDMTGGLECLSDVSTTARLASVIKSVLTHRLETQFFGGSCWL